MLHIIVSDKFNYFSFLQSFSLISLIFVQFVKFNYSSSGIDLINCSNYMSLTDVSDKFSLCIFLQLFKLIFFSS